MLRNSYEAYKQQSVMTMTPSDMLTMLYDALLKNLSIVKVAFESKDYAKINEGLQKTQQILWHLRSTLDFKYEISNHLEALYDYFIQVAIRSNVQKDPSELDDMMQMITELRDTYIEASRQMRPSK